MNKKDNSSQSFGFRYRKIVHYSLIVCILLIQLIIAAFFYNEFIKSKNLSFIKKQLEEVHSLENLTDNSKNELLIAQEFLQKYMETKDETYLNSYFRSLNILDENLNVINKYENKFPKIKEISKPAQNSSSNLSELKQLIDSTYQYSSQPDFKINNFDIPSFKKYSVNYDFDKFDVVLDTKVFKDTIKKKGLFGRIGDAISGKGEREKDSVVVTVKHGVMPTSRSIKADFDSILRVVNHHYLVEGKKMKVRVNNTRNNNDKFYKVFNNLFVYSTGLMNVYEQAIEVSKTDLKKEYEKQSSKNNQIRTNLVFGAMILMFVVSVLIMLLTRIAFIYEKRLSAANLQIKENLNFKNRILGMLSHELRSPLKIIGLFINRINKKTNDESIKEYLKSISFTNNTLLMQANQILEYTKNQQVENKIIPVVFNLSNEISAIMNSMEPYIETRNNQFIVRQEIDKKIEVFSDNTKINQIFMNILGNANKFTENGKITVDTKSEFLDDHTVVLTAKISDTGVGISQTDLKNIFEPYYQGVLSTEVENLGAGLGLSLCKELVELYNGEISVESEQNQGTTVSFRINLEVKH
ncbi:sensor histidine kinase [Chryseobacterium echinoideorum]|uniref:sensor histidine kinase n=1 Tax=Chryseobacterium echinoideorum TaxID=1549648 RepID=UPI001185A23B|nr:HAMP domain-containing sensor histidine kinase [Chryseobacterium echinoideorum]